MLALSGCHHKHARKSVDQLDRELTSENAADPALKGALEDQIMVDPQLAAKANAHSIRPPDEPYSTPLPPTEKRALKDGSTPQTLGQTAQSSINAPQAGCNFAVAYSTAWVTKLPSDLPIYPQGHVTEAAGSDTPTCHLRVVSFTSNAPAASVADFYMTHGRDAGYAPSQSGDTVRGTRAKDGAMFVITIAPTRAGGSQTDIVSNAGI
jgi:hypothetical protein